jgi:hypothetical protein
MVELQNENKKLIIIKSWIYKFKNYKCKKDTSF